MEIFCVILGWFLAQATTYLMQSYFQLTLILISSSITFQQPTKPEIACRNHHHIGSSHYGSFLYSN